MVGPEGIVSSASGDDDVQGRQNDDEEPFEATTDMTDVDVVQLLTRRLSVTPPCCHAALERRQMTASPSTEVVIQSTAYERSGSGKWSGARPGNRLSGSGT